MTEKTKRNIDYTLATFAVEGLQPSKEAVELYIKMDEGKLSLADTIAAIERKHGVVGGWKTCETIAYLENTMYIQYVALATVIMTRLTDIIFAMRTN